MQNVFAKETPIANITKRFKRIFEFKRISLKLILKVCFLYFKKLIKLKFSNDLLSDNYYFLTLINSNCYNIRSKKDHYLFKNSTGNLFTARKLPSSDLEVFNQVWGRKEYESATDVLLKILNNANDKVNIIDAGANVGYCTIFFSSIFKNATILSIEPDEKNYLLLKENIKQNQLSNVTPIKAGLWSHSCNLKIIENEKDKREWAYYKVNEVVEETGLKGIGIQDIMQMYSIQNIDLLKIDIEGAEKYLFRNRTDAIKFLSKTQVLAIEIHEEEVSREYIYAILEESGFCYYELSDLTICFKK